MYSITIHAEAEKHIAEHYLYYEEQLPGLGSEFISSFETCLKYIQSHPLSSEAKYKGYRMAMINRFPYGAFYLINQKHKIVLVAGVYFLQINPTSIKRSLRKI